jgi:hypothetical protein
MQIRRIKKIAIVFIIWILATSLLSGCLISDLEYWNELYRKEENRRIEEKNEAVILILLTSIYIEDLVQRGKEESGEENSEVEDSGNWEFVDPEIDEADDDSDTEISEEEAFNQTFNMFFHGTGSNEDQGSGSNGNYVDLTIGDEPAQESGPALAEDNTAAGDEGQETAEEEQGELSVGEDGEAAGEDTVEAGEAGQDSSDSRIEDSTEQGVITYRYTYGEDILDGEMTLHIDFDSGDCYGLISEKDFYGFASCSIPLVGSVDLVTKELTAHSDGGIVTWGDGTTESAGYIEITGKLVKLDTRIEGYIYDIDEGSSKSFYADSVLK